MRAYVPRWLLQRHADGGERPGFEVVDGSLLSADVSGFTKLSEELAALGKEGAEELTARINEVFTAMIGRAEALGGDVLKFGGDALLVLFGGDGHARRAVQAARAMRGTLAAPVQTRAGRKVQLRVSTGVHAGTFHLHLVHGQHLELLVTGPGTTTTVRCEAAAGADRIVASIATLPSLPAEWVVEPTELGAYVEPSDDEVVWLDVESDTDGVDASAYLPRAIVPLIDAGETHGGHRQVTVGFLAFAGTDELLATVGPEEVQRRLAALALATSEAAFRHGAHWLATDVYPDGGKFIVTAGAPTSQGNDEAAVLSTLHAVLSRFHDLPVRAGVNAGPVFVGDVGSSTRRTYTIMGDSVNLAARLMQKAEPGQLIASRPTLDRATISVRAVDLEPFLVKGKSAPIDAARVESILGTRVRGPGSRVPLVGRAQLVAELAGILQSPRSGRASVVSTVGVSGVGKTRLLDEIRRPLSDLRHVVMEAGATARAVPYEPVRRLLRGLIDIDAETDPMEAGEALADWLDEVAPRMRPWIPLLAIPVEADVPTTDAVERVPQGLRQARLHQVLLELLDALLDGPALIVLDDLHAFDDASRAFVRDLVAGTVDRAWSVLCAREPDDDPFDDYLNALTRHQQLGPLSPDASRQLVLATLGDTPLFDHDVQLIVERGQGNPMMLIEYARAAARAGGADALPGSLEALVTSQLDRLDPRDLALVRVASVLGDNVDLELLAKVGADLDVDVHDARVWGRVGDVLARTDPTTFAFRQSLHRRVAYESLSFVQRRLLHARAAEALSEGIDTWTQERAARVSEHLHHAEEHEGAYRVAVIAAQAARAASAAYEATLLYERALANAARVPSIPADERGEHAEALGDVAEIAGRFDLADEAFATAQGLRAEEPIRTATLMRKRADIRERQGRYGPALRWLTRALKVLGDQGDTREALGARAEVENAYCGIRFRQGKYRDCITRGLRAIELAGEADRPDIAAHAHYILDSAHTHLRLDESVWPRGMALRIYEQIDDQVGRAATLNNLGVYAQSRGEWDLALRLYGRAREAREQIQDGVNATLHAGNIAEVLADQGHYDEAARLLTEALRTFRASRFTVGIHYYTAVLARTVGRQGDLPRAQQLFDEAIEGMRSIGAAGHAMEFEAWYALCLARRYATGQSVELGQRLLAESDDPLLRAQMLRVLGVAAARDGDWDTAVEHFTGALASAEDVGSRFDIAMAVESLARVVPEPGDADRYGRRAGAALEFLGVTRIDGEPLPPPRPVGG